MKVVLQRSKQASVTVDGEITGAIDSGYVLLVGITHSDSEADAAYAAKKIAGLRLFEDEDGKMNRSIEEASGSVLSISQFTLYGDVKKGRRPSFVEAARPEQAEPLWLKFNEELRRHGLQVETGKFGAMMNVQLINDGPVTILIDSDAAKK
ncbi:D-tyrosyl-tRNA(Tyr) deacylase [Planococcus plakortidis]|uniref:D-aminoacyl-tRNA deacylase n=1 Tax=Planococcus plakortidis TaxID=1038856 RepID=A0A1C7E5U9_9BACL|nr:D-aminoacyl-tRNA deacylase [Planococcus plakortidis]ANU19220.1 D-tyrosyl-tRNA(Tyr) deacylase [Planococcus plakortidis]